MRKHAGLIDMTDIFKPTGIAKLEKGHVLGFTKNGKQSYYRIVSLANGRVFARKVRLYKPEEVQVTDKEVG